ncbi:MAG: HigA family addiction module antidote protein [bacterium]|nr:HigA family addiction module antidote protein [bacterium]
MRRPTHPGEILREDILPAIGGNVMKLAENLGVSRQNLHRILAEKGPVTANMALRLGTYFGNSPEFWLNMQQAVDLWDESNLLRSELRRIKPRDAA